MFTVEIFAFLLLLPSFDCIRETHIAHLLSVDANTIYEGNVMQMCIEDLKDRSIIPKELSLK